MTPRLIMAAVILLFGVAGYFLKNRVIDNPITDSRVRVSLTVPEQVALGLQAAPQMAAQHGGEHPDPALRQRVKEVGRKLVAANARGDWAAEFEQYQWGFHLLADSETINAFALPGGQIFITHGLYRHLGSEDALAGVLAHEIAHVIGQHTAQQLAKNDLFRSIASAVYVAGSDYTYSSGQVAQMVNAVLSTRYSRDHETESDRLGVLFMVNAGYDPEGLLKVMQVLEESSRGGGPEFLQTHPNPGNRIGHIRQVIEDVRAGRIEGPR